jgi:16S rRNA (cytosine1407-C5)-methyltransferase
VPHPFDRYAAFTDVEALKAASERPLRKSMRVNTLKCSVPEFLEWAAKKGWTVAPVPWCEEGFFIDREDRHSALGKDLLHLLGHVYMQEAASMFPVELLDVQPGHAVLDMAAAPGSKTTQALAKMGSKGAAAQGVLIANDVQEKRLWTLKAALHRSGVTNNIVTKKVGQWFGKQMTERFDRVLCDAPCTAQGTARKDSDALLYSSEENAGKMARLQKEMLEAAIHAAKVGGRIVYSTCTLTPEENEGVIAYILNKYSEQVEALDAGLIAKSGLEKAIEDSHRVQRHIGVGPFPSLRLWPQTFDTEGFFCALLHKKAPTRKGERLPAVRFQEDPVPRSRQRELEKGLEEAYGTPFLFPGEQLFQRGTQLILSTEEVSSFHLPVQDYALGMPFGRRLEDTRLRPDADQATAGRQGRVRIDHEIATLRGHLATKGVMMITEEMMAVLLDGKDVSCPPQLRGDILLNFDGKIVGFGLAKDGLLRNRLPRWMIWKS